MGWLYSPEWPTKAAMIKHLTDPATFSGKATTIAKAVRGNTLWTVIEYTADGASYPKGTRAILCFLLGGDTKRGASLIVWAIAEGRKMARGIDAYLRSGKSARVS